MASNPSSIYNITDAGPVAATYGNNVLDRQVAVPGYFLVTNSNVSNATFGLVTFQWNL